MTNSPPGQPPRVPTSNQVIIIARYNFLNYFRARRFYVMLAIVLIIGTILTVAVAYFGPDSFAGGAGILPQDVRALAFYAAAWGGFVSLVVILSSAFFGGDAISAEFQNKTGYFLIPNPIRRSAVYAGKWLAALLASSIVLGVFELLIMANGLYYFGTDVPAQFLESVAFAWIFLVAALSLAFAFSSLFKSSAISMIMSVIMFVFVFNVIDTVASTVAGIEPWFTLSYGAMIITNVLSLQYPAHYVAASAGRDRLGFTPYHATIPEGLAIAAAYFVVMSVLGLWLFEKKEFT